MLKLTIKSLFARKLRFALTSFAVVLSVAFVSGSFITADSLRATFDDIAQEVVSNVNVQVRGVAAFADDNSTRPLVPEELAETVSAVDGVAYAQGSVVGFPRVSYEGELLTTSGGPTLGYNYDPNDPTSAVTLVPGSRAPAGGEVMIDSITADRYGISIGDTVNIRSLAEPEDFVITGLFFFGEEDFGVIFMMFETSTAQRLFDALGSFQTIEVRAVSGVTEDVLADRVNEVLPANYEAVTSGVVEEEFTDQFSQIISIFQTALLAFAAVALVVSAFIINNTFSIVLGQRIKELGLLRCLGATGRQVRASVIGEALLIGVLASLIGVLAGIGVAAFISFALEQAGDGGGLPAGPIIIGLRTWIVSVGVGVGMTLLASIAPARRAASVPPIAAISDQFILAPVSSRRRSIIGVILGVVGALLSLLGVFGGGGASDRLFPLAFGALLLFLATALLSPLMARPVALALGAPIARIAKTPGQLARENAARNPRRTSSTASALMVGLALVAMVLIVGESFKATFSSTLDTSLRADYFVQLDTNDQSGFSPQLVADLKEVEGVGIAVGYRGGPGVATMRIDGITYDVLGTQQEGLGTLVDADLTQGSYQGLENNGLLVYSEAAEDLALSSGDTLSVEFPGGTRNLTVVGIYDDATILGNWVISINTYEEVYTSSKQYNVFAAVSAAEGVDPTDLRPAVDAVAANYPETKLENREEFQKSLESQIDQLLLVVNALLIFAIVIASLGVVNTLMLSVFERIRELGLLRAVGMTRRQTRRMIRWEAVIVTVFGGILGVLLGLVFAFIAIAALPESFISSIGVPVFWLIGIVVLCVVLGMLAAILPARRAARLNVLDAISHI